MIPQKQLYRHDPANGVYGDCYRTVIACLLDLAPTDVPHINEDTGASGMKEQGDAMDVWLAGRGLREINIAFPGDTPLADVLSTMEAMNPGLRFMITGTSRNETNHCVICRSGEIEWDPSLTDSGIVGPADNGFWLASFLGVRV